MTTQAFPKPKRLNWRRIFAPICKLNEYYLTIKHNVHIDGHDWMDDKYKTTKSGGTIYSHCRLCSKPETSRIIGFFEWDNFMNSHAKK